MPQSASSRLSEQVIFILVEPQHPGNVGAAARAMMNMGLRRLIVVNPSPSFDMEKARWMAPGADEVLHGMRIVASLEEALSGVTRVVATTARHRKYQQPVHEPHELAEAFFASSPDEVLAILFGREDTGLSQDDTLMAESLLRVATDHHASLNLGQAVLLIAHSFFERARKEGLAADGRILGGNGGTQRTRDLQADRPPRASVPMLESGIADFLSLLDRIGYTRTHPRDRTAGMMREGFQRAGLSVQQFSGIRGMLRKLNYALEHPGEDWTLTRRERSSQQASSEE